MNATRAFVVGVIGTAIMSLVMMLLRAGGVPLDIETRLASLFGSGAWFVGFAVYLAIGGVIAFFYAAIFEWVLHQAGVLPGLLLGACNTIAAGFVWAAGSDPGRFWQHFGPAGMAALFLVHFVYGAVVGGLYRTDHRLEYW